MQNQYRIKHTTQRGMTLIELIAALGVAAVVIVGALSLYQSADDSQKSNELLSGVTAVRGAIRQIYGGQYTGVADLLLAVNNARKLPSSWTYAGGSATYIFGTVTARVNAADSSMMDMTLNRVPAAVCATVVTALQGWTSVAINGQAAINYPLTAATRGTASTNCAGNAGGAVTIVLTGT